MKKIVAMTNTKAFMAILFAKNAEREFYNKSFLKPPVVIREMVGSLKKRLESYSNMSEGAVIFKVSKIELRGLYKKAVIVGFA